MAWLHLATEQELKMFCIEINENGDKRHRSCMHSSMHPLSRPFTHWRHPVQRVDEDNPKHVHSHFHCSLYGLRVHFCSITAYYLPVSRVGVTSTQFSRFELQSYFFLPDVYLQEELGRCAYTVTSNWTQSIWLPHNLYVLFLSFFFLEQTKLFYFVSKQ